jgi:hypothetical protein
LLLAALGVVVTPTVASAGIIFVTSSSTSSRATANVTVQTKTNSATGSPDLQDGTSVAVSSFGARGSNTNAITVTHQEGEFNPSDFVLSASLSNTGSSRLGFFFTAGTSTGSAHLNVTFTITDQPYEYVLTDVGSASASHQRGFTNASSATLTSDLFSGSDSATASNSTGPASFDLLRSGTLKPGTYTFSAALDGSTRQGDESSPLSVQLELTPVPEPASIWLMGVGGLAFLVSIGLVKSRRRVSLRSPA